MRMLGILLFGLACTGYGQKVEHGRQLLLHSTPVIKRGQAPQTAATNVEGDSIAPLPMDIAKTPMIKLAPKPVESEKTLSLTTPLPAGAALLKVPSAQPIMQSSSAMPPQSPMEKSKIRQRVAAAGFSFWIAWVDVACLTRFTCSTSRIERIAHRIAAAAATFTWLDIAFFFAGTVVYILGVVVHALVDTRVRHRGKTASSSLLAPFVLALFLAADLFYKTLGRWSFMPLVLAFGILNNCAILVTGTIVHLLTGHARNIGEEVADRIKGKSGPIPEAILKGVIVLLGFFAGATISTVAIVKYGLPPYPSIGGVMLTGLLLWLDWPFHSWRRSAAAASGEVHAKASGEVEIKATQAPSPA